jgi:hypothetical protein
MTDVEQLLRETLADPRHRLEPLPGIYDGVRQRARHRQQRMLQLASAVTVVVVIAGVATAVRLNTNSPRKGQPTASLSAAPPAHAQFNRVDIGAGSTGFLSVTPSAIFLAQTQPNQLVEVSPSDLSIVKQIATPDAVDGTTADAVEGLVWTWSSTQSVDASGSPASTDSTSIHAYTTLPGTVTIKAPATVPAYTFSAAALNGEMWLATSEGLYVVALANASWTVTKLFSGSVFSIAADDARHRILFGTQVTSSATSSDSLGSIVVRAIDSRSHKVTTVGTPVPVGKESIAVVDGQVWVAGYGSDSLLIHLDAKTLRPIGAGGSGLGKLDLGPGAIVWPGESVVWVRAGGSEALSCIDPKTGAVLEQWDAVQGPVASVVGRAYAASDGSLEQLNLTGGCKG